MNAQQSISSHALSLIIFLSGFAHATAPSSAHFKLNIEFQHITQQSGFPSTAYSMCQDHLGYIWFGCSHGACRFDGYEFKLFEPRPDTALIRTKMNMGICEDPEGNIWLAERDTGILKWVRKTGEFILYTHNPNDTTTLSSNDFGGFFLDSHGCLWIAAIHQVECTFAITLDRMDSHTGRVKRYPNKPDDPTTPSADQVDNSGRILRRFLPVEDAHSNVWFLTYRSGLNRYNRASDNFTRFRHDPNDSKSLSSDNVYWLNRDKAKTVWISTEMGVNHYLEEKNAFEHFSHNAQDSNSLATNDCYDVFQGSSDYYWISHSEGTDRYDPDTKTFRHYKSEPDNPSTTIATGGYCPFYVDRFDRLWILVVGYTGSVNIYDPQLDRFHRLETDLKNPQALHAKHSFYFEGSDRSGTLWLGTPDHIINHVDANTNRFFTLTKDAESTQTLLSDAISFLYTGRKDSMIWIATQEGLSRYRWKEGQFDHFRHDPKNIHSLCDNRVNNMTEDDDGILWIATQNGLDKLDNHGRFTHFRHVLGDSSTLSENNVIHLAFDPVGYLWICTARSGLNRLELKTGRMKRYAKDIRDSGSLNMNRQVFCVFKDRFGDLYVSADRGLSKYNYTSDNFSVLQEGFVIFKIFEDKWGNLWLGELFNGLVHFDRATGKFRRFDDGHPLAGCWISEILQDEHGILWILTSRGLVRYHPNTGECLFLQEHLGLPESYSLTTGIFRPDGQILLGTATEGLAMFDPKEIDINRIPPQVVITDIKIADQSLRIGADSPIKQDISLTKELHLAHNQNDIIFVCAALHYVRPEKNQYAFRLENYDSGWRQAGTTRTATYTNLDPGRYIFHVKAANCDGVWNEEGRSLAIVIHPPWYASAWAFIIYALLTIFSIVTIWKAQLRRIYLKHTLLLQEAEAKKLQEIDHIKTRFLANISHEFRTPLTLILGPLDNLRKKLTNDEQVAEVVVMQRNALRLSRLVNQLLDLTKIEAGKMKLQARKDDLIHFAHRIVQLFESRAKLKNIIMTFEANPSSVPLYFDQEKMEHVFYNLLSNALKFTPENGSVGVIISIDNDVQKAGKYPEGSVKISVQDTGIGIPPEQIEKIFDRFYQGEGSAKNKDAGTGIGLALAKELVDLHHGEISVQSVVGKGSTFIVRLPLGSSHLKDEEMVLNSPTTTKLLLEEPGGQIKQSQPVSPKSLTVLIVEDNADLRYYMRKMLMDDYKIAEAENGLTGYKFAVEHIPDLIVTDVMMPELDGFEFCQKLKTDERTSHIPIIMLTARADMDSKIHGLEIGADDYLVKPFNETELKVRAKNLIEQRQKLRERFSRNILTPIGEVAVTSADERFLQRAVEIISKFMAEPSFGPEPLAKKIGLSRSQLHRKLKATVNMSTTEFIRSIRLRRAAELLTKKYGTIGEIAYEVGFSSPSYFIASFRRQFNCLPSNFVRQNHSSMNP